MNRSTIIDSIIKKREPLPPKIEGIQEKLKSLVSKLNYIEQQRSQLMVDSDEDIVERIKDIDFLKIRQSITTEVEELNKLKARFSHKNLNLGVVGMARQGKSRLLQSLTGLTSAEIPDGDRGHCTGVRSTIYQIPKGSTYGMVWFHSEESFLEEVIAPYYEKLRLGERPKTLVEFSERIPVLLSDIEGKPIYKAMYISLVKYHKNIQKYRHLFGKPSPQRIAQHEIREYVAQDNLEGDRLNFNYMAVEKVSIFCTFPQSDLGKIALIDMPGLGDTGVGSEERMIETLGLDVDAVLFVRMPKAPGDDWLTYDLGLYDTAKNALCDRLPLQKWSFLVLNEINGENGNSTQCQFMKSRLSQTPMEVVDAIVANCGSREQANTLVLDPVIEYLGANIESLDKEYASYCRDEVLKIHDSVSDRLSLARQAFSERKETVSATGAEFRKLFKPLWLNLTRNLRNLVENLRKETEEELDTAFKAQVDASIQACRNDTGIPSIEDIEYMRLSPRGGYSYNIVYNIYLNQVRTHLSKKFALIDGGLKESIERAKSRVTDVLVDAGCLRGITEARGSEFIKVMAEKVPDAQSRLKRGFQILSEFDLSYSSLFQHRIRRELDEITPDKTSVSLSDSPSAKEVQEKLKGLHEKVLDKCENVLQSCLWEPSQAAFGMVEEFVDQVLLSEDVDEEWQDFLELEKGKVWPDKFEPQNKRIQIQQEWNYLIENAVSANEELLASIQFLN